MASVSQTDNTITINDKINDKNTTLDSTTYNITSDHGTSIAQNQPIKTVTENMRAKAINTRANKHMEDTDWDLVKCLERRNFVETISWNTSQPSGTTLKTYVNPYEIIVSQIGQTPFKTFSYARWKYLKLSLQVQASRFQSGQLIAWFHPTMTSGEFVDDTQLQVYTGKKNQMLLEHALIQASQSDMVELLIPFAFNKGWIDFNASDALGTIGISVFNQLTAATGTTTEATINIYASLIGAQFRVPRPLDNPPAMSRPKIKHDFEVIEAMREIRIRGRNEAAMGFLSEITEDLKPVAQVVDMFTDFLDKKQYGVQYQPIANKDQQYMSNIENDEYLEKLTLNPKTMQLTDHEHYASDVNVLKASYLLKDKWNYLETLNYGTSSTTGQTLFSYKVGPFGFGFNPNSTLTPTTFDFLTKNFDFWRGSFKLCVQAVTTPLTEGRLMLVFKPGVMPGGTTTYEEQQSQYLHSCQIKGGQNEFSVTIPYLQPTPYTKVWNGYPLIPENYDSYFNGTIELVVATPLKITQNLPSTIDLNVFVAAGDDYEFHTPTFNNSSITFKYPISATKKKQYRKIKGRKESNESEVTPTSLNDLPSKAKTVMLCAKADSVVQDPATSHFGEHYTDLQQLCKRYQPVYSYKFTLEFLRDSAGITSQQYTDIVQGIYPLILDLGMSRLGITPFSIFRNENFVSQIMTAYRLQRTPYVAKIKLTGNTGTLDSANSYGYITYHQNPASRNNVSLVELQDLRRLFANSSQDSENTGGTIMPMTYLSESHVAEFYVPFLHHQATSLIWHPYDYITGEQIPAENSENFDNKMLVGALYNLAPDVEYTITTHVAFGDEATVGVFQGLPQYAFLKDTTGKSLYPDKWF